MLLAQAREAHAEAIALVKQGIDPRHIRVVEKKTNETMLTFSELWEKWLEFRIAKKPISPRTLSDYRGTYSRHLEKGLGRVRVCNLSRSFFRSWLIRTYQVGQQAEKLKGLFMRWGEFVEHEVSADKQHREDNVVTVQFGSR